MYTFKIEPYELEFLKPAKTSRNVFKNRKVYYIHLTDAKTGKTGVGEAAPLSLLSIDDVPNYEEILHKKLTQFGEIGSIQDLDLDPFPSIRFGIETALLSCAADKEERMYLTHFTEGKAKIPVNGLVWMNDAESMCEEALTKIAAGFDVIKFKVGALDFDDECRMLEKIRKEYSSSNITLRVDANGGFLPDEAMEKLNELSRFEIHSIEQPIKTNLWDDMAKLSQEGAIDIALDEELIGVYSQQSREKMLDYICPQYLILKPNLIGGVKQADDWIGLARQREIGWWATSALESNVGLNAIAQWVSTYKTSLHQGLGTGTLFNNNTQTKLALQRGLMSYKL